MEIEMNNLVLQVETLNLPEYFARKLRGQRVELIENGDSVIITPVNDAIARARGILKDSSFDTEKFVEMKATEKRLEHV
jgi:virulence-associated protein VagC